MKKRIHCTCSLFAIIMHKWDAGDTPSQTMELQEMVVDGQVSRETERDPELFSVGQFFFLLFFPTFFVKCCVKERKRFRNVSYSAGQVVEEDDTRYTGLTRPPVVMRVSAHKDEVRSIVHGYFQSQFRVSVYKVVGRPTQVSIQREEALTTVTNVFMTQYTIPIDTNQLPKLPSRDDVETWWMTNEQTMNLRSEHVWTIDVQADSARIFVGTHAAPSQHLVPAFIPIC
jgi:hypothetical protein